MNDDLSKPMHVKPSATPDQARALLAALELPDRVSLADGHQLPLMLIAQAVAGDSHPGDDVLHPFHLRDSARNGVKLRRLAKLVRDAGGKLALTGPIAMQCCELYSDSLCALGSMAFQDVQDAGNLGAYSPCINPMRDEASALALVVGVLLYEQVQAAAPAV